jgi:UDP-N-acetylmuramoyl-L-alanyl-D-glutamate--2,6-diaminopimelate ligase
MQLLQTPAEAARWLRTRVGGTLCTDSRRVRAGDGFIAWPGAASDARHYVPEVLARGAAACLVEWQGVEAFGFDDARVAACSTLKANSGPIAAAYFDEPSQLLAVLAVTGTNGKTSTAWWLAQALSNLKQESAIPCGLIGTLGLGRVPSPGASAGHDGIVATGLTTPDPVLLQQTLRHFVDAGLKACAIEASSIGLAEQRLAGTRVDTAIFTNFTQDHLDYHGSMAAYWDAKAALFRWPGLRAAVINIDDSKGAALALELARQGLALWTVSCVDGPAKLRATDIEQGAQGLCFTVREGKAQHRLNTALIGHYNVANLLGVMATLRALGVTLNDVVASCDNLSPVPGRMERLSAPGQALAVVDYAHTPDALAKALLALRPLARARSGRLWCLFGCGGDRDNSKRPMMGAVAAAHADRVVLTSDNPRSESPQAILAQILPALGGQTGIVVEPDRALAIRHALGLAAPQDVVLIAGKGHEDYQEVAGQRLPFSDAAQVRAAWQQTHEGAQA